MANQILPFCPTDTGSNLLTQGDYAVAADRTNGNQPGIASSKLVNKAIRQSAFMASQLAQYIADKLAGSVLDDGNTAALLAQFNSAFAPNDQFNIENLTLAATVGASALSISVKTAAAANASATDIIYVGVRSATLTSGVYNRRTITGALNLVISSGSTLGQTSAQPSRIYVYLIDNAGALELAASHMFYPEDALVTTTAEGGAGAADSATAIYSTTSRSNVPLRLIGYLDNTQATAGTWATAPSQIQLLPIQGRKTSAVQSLTGSGTYNVPAGVKYLRIRMVGAGGGGGGSGSSSSGGTGGTGGSTTFGSSTLTSVGGAGGTGTSSPGAGGAGTVNTGVTGVTGLVINGGTGGPGVSSFIVSGNVTQAGGPGGPSAFGLSGQGGPGGPAQIINSVQNQSGGGGGAGGYVEGIITAPLSSYAYACGTGGTAGTAGTSGSAGLAGQNGLIIVEEFY